MSKFRMADFQMRTILLLSALYTNVDKVLSFPVQSQNQPAGPLVQSSDTWAQVIANVAPLMALLGERNAKEYMRTASSWHQLLLLAVAPLGILSITVSTIRLSGPGFLRRLIGRDSERRSEALVELTPLSVSPAASVYTSRAVEIATTYERDRVAFVCGHVPNIRKVSDAICGFQQLLRLAKGPVKDDNDKEAILVIWRSEMNLAEVVQLCQFLGDEESTADLPTWAAKCEGTASLSYRTTGISPTQTSTRFKNNILELTHWRDLLASALLGSFMIMLQVLCLRKGQCSPSIFWMGIVGYLGIVAFTFGLLQMIQGEVEIVEEVLPPLFSNVEACWTFSDSRHAEHQLVKGPKSNSLIIARPRIASARSVLIRNVQTTVLAAGIVGSYVVYYLSMRVADWWVPLSSLGVIWIGAAYRAFVIKNFLVAINGEFGHPEHWIGLFRNTVRESLMATLQGADHRDPDASIEATTDDKVSIPLLPAVPDVKSQDTNEDYIRVEKENGVDVEVSEPEPLTKRTILLVRPAIRAHMRTWSGVEDVMKVGLEMAKTVCSERMVKFEAESLESQTHWRHLVRMRMVIYVPGLIWESREELYFALPWEFDLESLIRHVIKIIHVCMDHTGDVTMHSVDETTSVALSHVLCGPIASPPCEMNFATTRPTLREVLTALRDNRANSKSKTKFTLEQAILLPTIILAATYARLKNDSGVSGHEIQSLQKRHVDKLSLSGQEFLPSILEEFEKLGIWDKFMGKSLNFQERKKAVKPRDTTAGNYETRNVRDKMMDKSGKTSKPES